MAQVAKIEVSPVDPLSKWPIGKTASATDFVRHFGQYATTSLRQPIYITQHGRVNWALVNADLMTRIEGNDVDNQSRDARFEIILDNIASLVILLDDQLNITRMNTAARRHFELSEAGARSASFTTLFRDSTRDYLLDVCCRVRDSGNGETFEIDSIRYPGRTLHVQVVPWSNALVVTADVVSQAAQVRRAYAAAAAAESASDATNLIGRGRINVRGTITGANQTLATLAGTAVEKIMGLRLASLFEQESRDAVRDAVEGLLTDGTPFSLDAMLLDGSAANTRVTLGAGVERDASSISGAAFIVMARG